MTRSTLAFITVLLVAVLTGCAHPISLTSSLTAADFGGPAKIDRKVAIVVSDEDRSREVVTPGGGGDKVRYFPYRDLEPALYAALGHVFTDVMRVPNANDPRIQSENVQWVITPRIVTTSFSPSLVTWPPTRFTVELDCRLADANGQSLPGVPVMGEGKAEFDEFKGEFSLSARRATEAALRELVKAFRDAKAAH